jgi:hypothetical protein
MRRTPPVIDRQRQLNKGPSHYEHRTPRTPCDLPCQVFVNGQEVQAVLLDYHSRGSRVSSEQLIPVGARAKLVLPGCVPVDAAVRWSFCLQAGFLFESPIQYDLLARVISAASKNDEVPANQSEPPFPIAASRRRSSSR